MIFSKPILILRIICVCAIIALLQGCAKKDSVKPQAEKAIAATVVNGGQPQPGVKEKLPPPTMKEVEEAAHRVLGDDIVISSKLKPVYIVGDFNGDDVEDLAIAVEPVKSRLSDINGEFANWIIQDADKFFLPDPHAHVVKMPEVQEPKVQAGETLLLVVHGYGPTGWRNPAARQTYLVKHAAANFLGTGRSFREKYIREMKLTIETDVIKENRDSKQGFLFWTGSNYAWHPNNG
jgi:hypothetical protein